MEHFEVGQDGHLIYPVDATSQGGYQGQAILRKSCTLVFSFWQEKTLKLKTY